MTAIDDDTEVALRRAGLSHLLAVSGSNVAIVLGAVGATTAFLGARLRMAGAAGALGFYVLVVGPDAYPAVPVGGGGLTSLTSTTVSTGDSWELPASSLTRTAT